MELRSSGRSTLQLSALGVGCWAFGGGDYWGAQSQSDANAVVRRALELGLNYFDTAEAYNQGASETSLGEAIRGLPRDRLIIGTKVSPSNTAPAILVEHCEASLARLGTDYIDLYMVHWPITPPSIEHFADQPVCPSVQDAFATLMKLQAQGKIRHIGVSNFGVRRLIEAAATGANVVVNQLPYNLLSRAIELETLPYCRQQGIAVIGYMALMQGLLADLYPSFDDIPLWRRRTRHFNCQRAAGLCRHGEAGAEAETSQALAGIRQLAASQGLTMADLALKWALAGDGITCVLAGSRTAEKLEMNVNAATAPLEPGLVRQLNAITTPLLEKLGPSFDYFEHPRNDRTR